MNTKRIKPLLLVLGLALANFSFSQTWEKIYEETEGGYLQKINAVEESIKLLDTSEYNSYRVKHYYRFKAFWDDRIDKQGNTQSYSYALADAVHKHHAIDCTTPSNGMTWRFIGADHSTGSEWQGMGHVRAIWVDTSDMNTILAGSNSGGLFKSDDGGRNWIPLTDNYFVTGVTDIVVNPLDKDEIYISSYLGNGTLLASSGFGILKSLDGGKTWQKADTSAAPYYYSNYNALYMHPAGVDTMFAIQNSWSLSSGQNKKVLVYRTEDKWLNRDTVYYGSDSSYCYLEEMKFRANNPKDILLYGDVLLRSNNGGDTWANITDQIGFPHSINQIEVLTHPVYDRYGLLIVKGDSTQAIYRTHDFFNTFDSLKNIDNIPISYFGTSINGVISYTDTNTFVFGGITTGAFTIDSLDAVKTKKSFIIHDDNRSILQIYKEGKDNIFVGNDGGLISTTDYGETIKDRSLNGLAITQHYGVSIDPDGALMFAGTQDGNQTQKVVDKWWLVKSDAYRSIIPKDTEVIPFIDLSPEGPVIGLAHKNGNSYLAGCVSYREAQNRDTILPSLMAPIELNPLDHNVCYTGGHDLFRFTTNNLDTLWQALSDLNHTSNNDKINKKNTLRALSICPADTNCIIMAYANPASWDRLNNGLYATKLFRTRDYGQNWEHITDNILHWSSITDLAFSAHDPAKVWLTAGLYNNKHVFFSQDTGRTWTAISQKLDDIPAFCVTYDPYATNNQIYVGNSLGAWYTNDSLVDGGEHIWLPMAEGLPFVPVTEIAISHGKNKRIVAATFGRGVWELDYDCFPKDESATIYIDNNETWNTPRLVKGDVFVSHEATLTILNTEINFAQDVTITVDTSSKLVIDNSKLTCGCSDALWGGIRSLGTNNTLIQDQAWIVIKNNSKVEFARAAVCNAAGSDSSGGYATVISASNSTFINNQNDFLLKPYKLDASSTGQMHISLCDFKTDDLYYQTARSIPIHIYNTGADDVNINGCSFANVCILQRPIPERGIGIVSYASTRLKIKDVCIGLETPCNEFKQTEFNNLEYGVKFFSWGPDETFSIENSLFEKNWRGIYASGSNLPRINGNTFRLNRLDNINTSGYNSSFIYGCYLEQCTAYEFMNNYFYDSYDSNNLYNTLGLILLNSGTENNLIYNNEFSQLKYGIYCQGIHHHLDTVNTITGLEIRCNDFDRCYNDIVTIPAKDDNQQWVTDSRTGPKLHQGLPEGVAANPEDLAGNTFSDWSYSFRCVSLDNWQTDQIIGYKYFYHYHIRYSAYPKIIRPEKHLGLGPSSNPTHVLQNLTINYTAKDTACPSDIYGGGAPVDAMMDNKSDYSDSINSIAQQLAQLIDAGDTPGLSQEAQYAQPQDSAELLTNLQASSPYLSDTVLKNTATNDLALSNEKVRDIMVSNPQSAKNQAILHQLEERQNPLSPEMMAEILEQETVFGGRERLEIRKGNLQQKRDRLAQNIQRHFLIDSTDYNSLISCIQGEPGLQNAYREAFFLAAFGNKTSANDKMLEIGSTLNGNALQEHQKLYQIMQLQDSILLVEQIKSDSLIRQNLMQIGHDPNSLAAAYARNILLTAKAIEYSEPLYLKDEGFKSGNAEDPFEKYRNLEIAEKDTPKLSVYPNPATEKLNIRFSELKNSALLSVYDANGKIMDAIMLSNGMDQYKLNLQNYPTGSYFLKLADKNLLIETRTFNVINN